MESTWRRLAVTALLSFLTTTLLVFGLMMSALMILSKPDSIKQVLLESGIYTTLPENLLHEENAEGKTSSVPVDRAEVKTAVNNAFPPELLEKDAEQIIDGMYAWLQGKTDKPEFRVDLTGPKETFAASIGEYVRHRLEGLPKCTSGVATDIDVFTTECVPPQLDIVAASDQAKRDVLGAGGPLEEPVLTADTLKDGRGRSLTEQFQGAPALYQNLHIATYGLGVLAAIIALLTIWLYKPRRAGVARAGIVLITAGVISGLMAWLGNAAIDKAVSQMASSAQQSTLLQEKIGSIIQLLTQDVRNVLITYAGILVLIGLVLLLAAKLIHKRTSLPPPKPTTPLPPTTI